MTAFASTSSSAASKLSKASPASTMKSIKQRSMISEAQQSKAADAAELLQDLLLPAEEAQLADEGELDRYLRACNGNVQEAAKRLRATFAWRAVERPETLACTVCEHDPRSHFMHVIGHDDIGRPIIYSCLANVTDRKTENNKLHMLATFQQAIRLMPKGVSQWVWACDFHGFGMSDVDPAIARLFLHISAEHYPERLGHFLVLCPPSVFSLLWKCVQPWVDPVTKEKITFVPRMGPALDKALQKQQFSPELADWLRAEMQENRDGRVVKSKVYSYQRLLELALQPQEEEEGGKQPAKPQPHSVYGTPSLMRRLRECPEALQPLQPNVLA